MKQYLLPCTCGKDVIVEPAQAGDRVQCACGTALDVPPLRKLRHFPLAQTVDHKQPAAWTFRHAVLSATIIATIGFGLLGAYFWFTYPQPTFDAAGRTQAVEQTLAQLTPLEAWQMWTSYYQHLIPDGFVVPKNLELEKQQADAQLGLFVSLGAAGASLLLALAALVIPRQHR